MNDYYKIHEAADVLRFFSFYEKNEFFWIPLYCSEFSQKVILPSCKLVSYPNI